MNWNHILHVVRKDFRAERFHLTLWAILLVLYVALLGFQPSSPAGPSVLSIAGHLIPGVVMVYGLVLIVTLIHHDPVAGTSGFWLTRPVRGASLLAAKAIEAATVVALWFVADFLVLVGNDVPSHLGYLAFDFASVFLPAMLAVFAIAALVRNTPKFFLAIALVVIGLGLGAMILDMVVGWFVVSEATGDLSRSAGEKLSARVVGACVVSLGALAILALQFVTRRTRVSIVTAAVVAAGASVAFASWSRDFISPRAAGAGGSDQFAAVSVEIDSSDFRTGGMITTNPDGDSVEHRTVSGLTSVRGLPDGVFAEVESAHTRITTADGHEILQHPTASNTMGVSAPGLSAALNGAVLPGSDPAEKTWRTIVRASDAEFEQFAHRPCTLEREMHLNLYRYELLGELPLKEGAKGIYDGLQVLITGVAPYDHSDTTTNTGSGQVEKSTSYACEMSFHEKFPKWKLKSVREGRNNPGQFSNVTYVLVNRQRNEAVLSNGGGGSSIGGIRSIFRISDRHLDFQPHTLDPSEARLPQIDLEWLDGASLAIFKRNYLGSITRTAKIEDVVFEPKR